jgi:hypothetical protein
MSAPWLEILRREVDSRGATQVARELGVSTTTISLVINNRYGASTDNIQKRIQLIYGAGGHINCQALGEITPAQCVETWERASKVGLQCGNPATMRLHLACRKCDLRTK